MATAARSVMRCAAAAAARSTLPLRMSATSTALLPVGAPSSLASSSVAAVTAVAAARPARAVAARVCAAASSYTPAVGAATAAGVRTASFSAASQWSSSSYSSLSSVSSPPPAMMSSAASTTHSSLSAHHRHAPVSLSHSRRVDSSSSLSRKSQSRSFSASSSSQSSSSSSSSSSDSKKSSASEGFLGRELKYLKQHVEQKWMPKQKAVRKATPAVVRPTRGPNDTGERQWTMDTSKSKAQAQEEEQERLKESYGNDESVPSSLVALEDQRTVWEVRLENLSDRVRGTAIFRSVRSAKRAVETSDSPVIKSAREAQERLKDKIEDARDAFDTSQHPIVHKVRDVTDRAFGETEMAVAVAELGSDFHVAEFLDDMEDIMIPTVIGWFLKGDPQSIAELQRITEGEAARAIFASLTSRKLKGYPDTRILEVRSVDLERASLVHDTPQLELTFSCQHVHCLRKAPDGKGEIVEGSPSNVKKVQYVWHLQPNHDPSSPFEWKIVQFQFSDIGYLVA